MNKYLTINVGSDFDEIDRRITALHSLKIDGIRFNLCKYSFVNVEQATNEIITRILPYVDEYRFAFDLPFPKNKSRVEDYSMIGGLVNKGQAYIISKKFIQHDRFDCIKISSETNITCTDGPIYYGDGEGSFKGELVDENSYFVEALNTFTIHKNKAISCGFVRNDVISLNVANSIIKRLAANKPYLLLSFVSCGDEVSHFRRSVNSQSGASIISKIELVRDREEVARIVSISDGALLARGDLALLNDLNVQLDICEEVAGNCQKLHKPLFIATDVLSSLQTKLFPNRADIYDYLLACKLGCTEVVIPNNFQNVDRFLHFANLLEAGL